MAQLTMAIYGDASIGEVCRLRTFAAVASDLLGCPVDRDDLRLLVSELATNAVRACSEQVCVTAERVDPSTLRVTVTDDGEGEPALRRPAPLDPGGGRGLMIVDAVSTTWGVEAPAEPGSTAVWFELTASS